MLLLIQLHNQFLTSIDQINRQNYGVRIFPNPSNGLVAISLDALKDQPAIAEIYNVNGEIIQTKRFKGNIMIDLASIPKGIYVVRLVIDNEVLTRKLCLE